MRETEVEFVALGASEFDLYSDSPRICRLLQSLRRKTLNLIRNNLGAHVFLQRGTSRNLSQAVRVQGARSAGTAVYKGVHEGEAGFRAACCEPLNDRQLGLAGRGASIAACCEPLNNRQPGLAGRGASTAQLKHWTAQ